MKYSKIFLFLLIGIETITCTELIIPFVQYNNLYISDMPGHYFASWYIQNFLFPRPVGWNPFFFAGYPQGQFYPPLFHYLCALAGFLLGSNLGFKTIVAFSLLLLPPSFYYFSRKFSLSETESSISMLIMWLMLFIDDGMLGGNIRATFIVGLVTSIFALPILFFYFGRLKTSLSSGEYVLPSILLSMVILSHVYTGIVSLIILFSFFASKPGKRELSILIKHCFLTFLLVSFWVIPFLDKLEYTSPAQGYSFNPFAYTFALACMIFLAPFFMFTPLNKDIKPVFFSLVFITGIIGIGQYMQVTVPDMSYSGYFTRLMMPAIILIPFLIIVALRYNGGIMTNIQKIPLLIFFIAFLVLCYGNLTYGVLHEGNLGTNSINVNGAADLNIKFEKLDGRILDVPLLDMLPPLACYSSAIRIPMNTENIVMHGLFVESSLHARNVYQILSEIDPSSGYFHLYPLNTTNAESRKNVLKTQLSIFNVNYLFASDDLNWSNGVSEQDKIIIKEPNKIFSLVNSTQNNSYKVFHEMIDETDEYQTFANISGNATHLRFIAAPNETVTLLLTPGFRYWRAYANNKSEAIQLTTPLMTVQGTGTIDLAYEGSVYDALNATRYREVDVGYMNRSFILYKVDNGSLAEVLDYVPETVCDDWKGAAWIWFNSENISRVLVNSCVALPDYSGTGNETVKVLEVSRTGEYIKLLVSSDKPVPVYLKVSHFPNWRAYVNGKPAQVYRASPNMMLAYGRGIIEFRYEPTMSDYLGGFLSITGLCWVSIISFQIVKGYYNRRPK